MRLSRDQALLRAGGLPTNAIASAEVQLSSIGAIRRTLQPLPTGIEEPLSYRSTTTAWLVTTAGMFNQFGGGVHSVPKGATIVDELACRKAHSYFPDDPLDAGTDVVLGFEVTMAIDESNCTQGPLTRDLAIVIAGRAAWTDYGDSDPPQPTAEEMTLGQAVEALKQRGADIDKSLLLDSPARKPVWLVTLKGQFFGAEGEVPEDGATPRPTTVLSCADRFVIVDIEQRTAIYTTRSLDDVCD